MLGCKRVCSGVKPETWVGLAGRCRALTLTLTLTIGFAKGIWSRDGAVQ